MKRIRIICVLVTLLLPACEQNDSTVQPPAPLTPDQQTVANCHALQDAIEAYAAEHDGSYGGGLYGIASFSNPYTGEIEPSMPFPGVPGRIALESYRDCDGNVLGYRITGYGRDGVLITLEDVTDVPADVRTAHDATMANARLVFDAALQFAGANDGEYPPSTSNAGADGKTLIDLLPGAQLLTNSFSAFKTEPQDGLALAVPGAIGYIGLDMAGDGTMNGFVLEAYDCGGAVMLTLLPYSEKEEFILQDGLCLRLAVHAFGQASGHYPHNLDTETTPGGKTVLDLYADSGRDFTNQYTNEEYVPGLGIATNPGEVAYQPIETDGIVTDFLITARNVFEEIQRIGPLPY